jgi:transcriptional regulator with XRE-family HTH domain
MLLYEHFSVNGLQSEQLMQVSPQDRQTEAHSRLAVRIRDWRETHGLSQAELAEKAGFARSTLSKIENGQLSPTFEILLKLARGFGVELSELVRNDAPQLSARMQIVRGVAGDGIHYDNNHIQPLAGGLKGRSFQTALVTFTTTEIANFGPWNSHETEDMLYVLSGQLVFHSEGYETAILAPGDSLHFDGTMPHACLSGGDGACHCLYVFAQR